MKKHRGGLNIYCMALEKAKVFNIETVKISVVFRSLKGGRHELVEHRCLRQTNYRDTTVVEKVSFHFNPKKG